MPACTSRLWARHARSARCRSTEARRISITHCPTTCMSGGRTARRVGRPARVAGELDAGVMCLFHSDPARNGYGESSMPSHDAPGRTMPELQVPVPQSSEPWRPRTPHRHGRRHERSRPIEARCHPSRRTSRPSRGASRDRWSRSRRDCRNKGPPHRVHRALVERPSHGRRTLCCTAPGVLRIPEFVPIRSL